MKKLFAKLNKLGVAVFCYAAYFAVWLLLSVCVLVFDSLYLNNSNSNIQLTTDDFELVDLTQNPDGTLTCDSSDPKLILKSDILVRNISYSVNGMKTQSEAAAFYAKSDEDDFSVRKRIWATPQKDGSLLYSFPDKQIYYVRIDPTTSEFETFSLNNITLNKKMPFYTYFVPSLTSIFYAIIFPGLAASIIIYLKQIFNIFIHKKIV